MKKLFLQKSDMFKNKPATVAQSFRLDLTK
jgi:hypothetical protein